MDLPTGRCKSTTADTIPGIEHARLAPAHEGGQQLPNWAANRQHLYPVGFFQECEGVVLTCWWEAAGAGRQDRTRLDHRGNLVWGSASEEYKCNLVLTS